MTVKKQINYHHEVTKFLKKEIYILLFFSPIFFVSFVASW